MCLSTTDTAKPGRHHDENRFSRGTASASVDLTAVWPSSAPQTGGEYAGRWNERGRLVTYCATDPFTSGCRAHHDREVEKFEYDPRLLAGFA